ncbi:MAG: imidazole glycerol phosphate synthase subunit HisH [Eubacteriales bacterium]|nr:imidazole glycerol phosphate synthase subunit HisH [Eubacteriales bacterium]
MIAIIDYGMGNLRSVQKAFEFLGFDARVTDHKQDLNDASHIVLPGVGAFADAADCLNKSGLRGAMLSEINTGKPFLGICLGMQLLFDKSYENGEYDGLSLVPGEVVPFKVTGLKVPHMGWNNLIARDNMLFDSGGADKYVYFVHSYHAADVPEEYIIAEADYGYRFTAAVQKGNVFGLQFHPEKSGDVGLDMLRRFGGLS